MLASYLHWESPWKLGPQSHTSLGCTTGSTRAISTSYKHVWPHECGQMTLVYTYLAMMEGVATRAAMTTPRANILVPSGFLHNVHGTWKSQTGKAQRIGAANPVLTALGLNLGHVLPAA